MCLSKGSSHQGQETQHFPSVFRERTAEVKTKGGVKRRRERKRNRHTWIFPKRRHEEMHSTSASYANILLQEKNDFSNSFFFASSQASFIATSSSHIVISSPEEEKNYRAQAFMQVSSKRPVWWKETSAACMIEELQ